MEKWEKTIFWIVLIVAGGFLICSLFGLDKLGIAFAVGIVSLMLILDTATKDMKSKWKAFGIRIGILIVVIFFLGIILGISSEAGGNLMGIILIFELIITITKKKK